jgi:hypothetical protein
LTTKMKRVHAPRRIVPSAQGRWGFSDVVVGGEKLSF